MTMDHLLAAVGRVLILGHQSLEAPSEGREDQEVADVTAVVHDIWGLVLLHDLRSQCS